MNKKGKKSYGSNVTEEPLEARGETDAVASDTSPIGGSDIGLPEPTVTGFSPIYNQKKAGVIVLNATDMGGIPIGGYHFPIEFANQSAPGVGPVIGAGTRVRQEWMGNHLGTLETPGYIMYDKLRETGAWSTVRNENEAEIAKVMGDIMAESVKMWSVYYSCAGWWGLADLNIPGVRLLAEQCGFTLSTMANDARAMVAKYPLPENTHRLLRWYYTPVVNPETIGDAVIGAVQAPMVTNSGPSTKLMGQLSSFEDVIAVCGFDAPGGTQSVYPGLELGYLRTLYPLTDNMDSIPIKLAPVVSTEGWDDKVVNRTCVPDAVQSIQTLHPVYMSENMGGMTHLSKDRHVATAVRCGMLPTWNQSGAYAVYSSAPWGNFDYINTRLDVYGRQNLPNDGVLVTASGGAASSITYMNPEYVFFGYFPGLYGAKATSGNWDGANLRTMFANYSRSQASMWWGEDSVFLVENSAGGVPLEDVDWMLGPVFQEVKDTIYNNFCHFLEK